MAGKQGAFGFDRWRRLNGTYSKIPSLPTTSVKVTHYRRHLHQSHIFTSQSYICTSIHNTKTLHPDAGDAPSTHSSALSTSPHHPPQIYTAMQKRSQCCTAGRFEPITQYTIRRRHAGCSCMLHLHFRMGPEYLSSTRLRFVFFIPMLQLGSGRRGSFPSLAWWYTWILFVSLLAVSRVLLISHET